MHPVQSYLTTITDNDSNLSLSVVVVPSRSVPEAELELEGSEGNRIPEQIEYLLNQLRLRHLVDVPTDRLHRAIAALLENPREINEPIYDTSFEAAKVFHLTRLIEDERTYTSSRDIKAFTDYVLNEDVIPFERSPLSGESLLKAVKLPAVGMGAYIGFVAVGASPLLFISVPAGMILIAASAGAAKALEETVYELVKRLMSKK